jgi:hypothetical protein
MLSQCLRASSFNIDRADAPSGINILGRKTYIVVAARCNQRLPLIAHGAAGALVCDMDRFAIPSLGR